MSEGSVTSPDGTSLFWQRWLPSATPVAGIALIHGAGEHGGRYPSLVAELVARGHAVYALDLRGHGRSAGRRGTVRRFSDFVGDLDALVALMSRNHAGTPIFLTGYSLGALVAASYALDARCPLAGLVLAGVAVGGKRTFGAQLSLARSLRILGPGLRVLRLDPTAMMQDPVAIRGYRDDPLIHHGRFDARMVGECAVAIRRLSARADDLTMPVLAVQGAQDRLADAAASRRLLTCCGSLDTTFRMYDRTHHDLFNEPVGARVASDVASWIDAHCDALTSKQPNQE